MSFFGEIIEPSSRSYHNFEDVEFDRQNEVKWEIRFTDSQNIKMLLLAEGQSIKILFEKILASDKKLVSSSKDLDLKIYGFQNDCYLCIFGDKTKYSSGEIIEEISHLLLNAEKLLAFQSLKLVTYHSKYNLYEEQEKIRMLSYDNTKKETAMFAPILERPNILTGTTAAGMNFRIFHKLPCQIYAWYLSGNYIDSSIAVNFLKVLNDLEIPYEPFSKPIDTSNNSNIYL